MKKRILVCLALVMALTLSLAAPALADTGDEPLNTDGEGGLTAQEQQALMDEQKTAWGGVPGQLGVMLNGRYITFPDAAPEAVSGRIMVPYRALMEAMGGQVDYEDSTQTVTCILDDTTLTLKLGEPVLTVQGPEGVTTIEMDCAAYAKGGRTYIPVRFVSQAFGYTVLWDASYETAVLLDCDALAGQIDQEFTTLNRILSNWQPEPGQAYESNVDANLNITMQDPDLGGQQYQFTLQAEELSLDGDGQGSVTLDLSSLLDNEMVKEMILTGLWDWLEEDQAGLESLLDSLDQISFSYIQNAEGRLWLRAPLLALYDSTLTDGAWLQVDPGKFLPAWLGGIAPAGLFSADVFDGPLTVGSLLCTSYAASVQFSYGNSGAVYLWEIIQASAQEAAGVLGDSCFTHTDAGDGVSDVLDYTDTDEYGTSTHIILVADRDSRTITLSLDLQQEGGYQIQLDLTGRTVPSNRIPLNEPPEGDKVVLKQYAD